MIEGLFALSLTLSAQTAAAGAGAVTIDKTSITPQGTQDVIVKVARPSMVHIAVDSDVGVTCTLIDHLRGPFFDDGVLGKTSCNADVLLDQGLYKLRLTAPGASPKKKAKGPGEAKVELKARLKKNKLDGHIVAVESVDKMTDRQVAARVRKFFGQ